MVTLKDVAKVAGVSIKTVSRVANDDMNVNPETRKKVKKLLSEMNYVPNEVARSLVTSRTNTIGVLLSNISNPFFPKVILGIEDTAKKLGYSVIICNSRTYDDAVGGINTFITKKVDGIIVTPVEFDNDVQRDDNKYTEQLTRFYQYLETISKTLYEKNVYFCLMNYNVNICRGTAMKVVTDESTGGFDAVEHLISLGHRRIAHITETLAGGIWEERFKGYKETLKKYQISLSESEYIQREKEGVQGGFDAMRKLLILSQPPTAVYAANDLFAIGAINALIETGYKIPGDISIIGYDGIDFGDMVVPHLTTIAHKRYEIGRQCMLRLAELIENRGIAPYDVVIRPELVVKGSTGPVKK